MPETRLAPAHWADFLLSGDASKLSETEAPVASSWKASLAPLAFKSDLGEDGSGLFGLGQGVDPYEGLMHRFELE